MGSGAIVIGFTTHHTFVATANITLLAGGIGTTTFLAFSCQTKLTTGAIAIGLTGGFYFGLAFTIGANLTSGAIAIGFATRLYFGLAFAIGANLAAGAILIGFATRLFSRIARIVFADCRGTAIAVGTAIFTAHLIAGANFIAFTIAIPLTTCSLRNTLIAFWVANHVGGAVIIASAFRFGGRWAKTGTINVAGEQMCAETAAQQS